MKNLAQRVSLKPEWICKLEIILLILVLIVGAVFILGNKNGKVKDSAVKKEEIIEQYQNDLQSLLKKHENNKNKQIEQKKVFIQNCNSELSRNIFFTHEESIKILKRLSQL
jgi:predicted PurR-regulated permease PerM